MLNSETAPAKHIPWPTWNYQETMRLVYSRLIPAFESQQARHSPKEEPNYSYREYRTVINPKDRDEQIALILFNHKTYSFSEAVLSRAILIHLRKKQTNSKLHPEPKEWICAHAVPDSHYQQYSMIAGSRDNTGHISVALTSGEVNQLFNTMLAQLTAWG